MVRTPSIASAFYAPKPVPDDPKQLARFLDKELATIAAVLDLIAAGHIDKVYIEPPKPREGDIRFADGTQWNPGSGEGLYIYRSAAWNLLG